MRMKIGNKHYIALMGAVAIIVLDFFFFFSFIPGSFGSTAWYFNPIIVLAILIGGMPFLIDFLNENKRQKELETKFLEFVRSLVETVRSGVSIPQAILHVSNANYGSLTPYVKKLAHQLEWGFPLHDALTTFAKDTKNAVIKRSVGIVIQAEKSGGDMGSVLEAVTSSVYEIKKVKEEQKSNSYSQTIQGYIIFFVFIIIMIVLQVYLVPKLGEVGAELAGGLQGIPGTMAAVGGGMDLSMVFNLTIIVQGFFAGLMVGKFSEGDFKSGIRHSVIMVVSGYLIMSTAAGIAGVGALMLIKEKWLKRE